MYKNHIRHFVSFTVRGYVSYLSQDSVSKEKFCIMFLSKTIDSVLLAVVSEVYK